MQRSNKVALKPVVSFQQLTRSALTVPGCGYIQYVNLCVCVLFKSGAIWLLTRRRDFVFSRRGELTFS